MTNKPFYIELSLNSVFITDEENKEELMKKIKECISLMLAEENLAHYTESINVISEEQIFAEYAASLSGDFN